MLISAKQYLALAAALQMSAGASAQNLKEQVWSIFAYNLHGDSIPIALPRPRALTPYGANDMYSAGGAFRNRYVAVHNDEGNASTRIPSLSPYLLESEEVSILSSTDQPAVASAQAFMQGLYPPLKKTYNGNYFDPSFQLANGSMSTAPMNGYQYAQVLTLSPADPRSILLDGQAECTLHQVADSEYQFSLEVEDMNQKSEAFYGRLHSQALRGIFDLSSAKYSNANSISEFLQYQLLHNKTLLHHLNREDIELARWYADHYVYATNGHTSSPGVIGSNKIRTIAGRTLASYVLEAFDRNIEYRGVNDKMTFLFGASEPAVALASLMQVASSNQEMFYPRPNLGASLVFELYSLESEAYPTYPEPSQLYVRFLLRNGTDSAAEFQSYPLFGHGPSNDAIPYSDFRAQMKKFSLGSIKQWCIECSSSAVFCSGVVDQVKKTPASNKGLNPAVAGVIGAVITVVTLALIAIVVFLVFGMRMKRVHRSGLGGFKGSNKMASDSDVTFKNTTREDVKTAEDSHNGISGVSGAVVRGHERTGSWEMRDQQEGALATSTGGQETVSPFENDHDDIWRRHSILEPVKALEHV
ncbi:uncharacterized protein ACLA_014570 [Aspergillus clavatus NRRL 1]|uniref:Histidine acid phosphatase, putative n=1 Tax=Aspergillus clavatus (strain ATCC 1007 / CBS 513.65 / DSM 816 / NCTC 3887 / NRRL 1 / QM 1276 / 107) TaxID=344612 RepID=A1CBA2_ASPCL|nr:histidine acid phosphatase, putative [Aspergillus clavatus NRRL 1]EAW13020.1 histidine acid phosphatase, putative [Aspergillus clavatus NRRL 1]